MICNPYNITNNGVLLSYGGTIGIITFFSTYKEKKKEAKKNTYKEKIFSYIKDIIILSMSAQILIMPIIAYNYRTISLTFILTNILTSYIIGLIIMFGLLLIIFSFMFLNFTKIIGNIYKLLINLLLLITKNTAKIPFSKIYVKMPYIYEIIVYYLFIFLLFYLYKKDRIKICFHIVKKLIKENYKKFISGFLIIMILFSILKLTPKALKIYFIDVDQGDACLITTPLNKSILIDRWRF